MVDTQRLAAIELNPGWVLKYWFFAAAELVDIVPMGMNPYTQRYLLSRSMAQWIILAHAGYVHLRAYSSCFFAYHTARLLVARAGMFLVASGLSALCSISSPSPLGKLILGHFSTQSE